MAISFVNAASAYDSSESFIDCDAINATTGNCLIVFTCVSSNNNVTGVSDTASNSYSKIGGRWTGPTNWVECWAAFGITGNASNVVRATLDASSSDVMIAVAQYSGVATSSALDTNYTPALNTDNSTPYTSGSDDTSENNELIVGLAFNQTATTTFTNGTGTIRVNELDVWVVIDRAAATAGTFTIDVAGDNAYTHVIVAVAIKQSAATIEQEGFRFRNDDGSESTATWKDAQDTNITLAGSTAFRLRMILNATGDPDEIGAQLECRYKPSGGSFGGWKKISSV